MQAHFINLILLTYKGTTAFKTFKSWVVSMTMHAVGFNDKVQCDLPYSLFSVWDLMSSLGL